MRNDFVIEDVVIRWELELTFLLRLYLVLPSLPQVVPEFIIGLMGPIGLVGRDR